MTNSKFYRLLPIVILIIGVVAFFGFGGQQYLSLEALKDNYQQIIDFASSHFLVSIVAFMFAYVLVVAFSIPGATIMTLLGGLIFGLLLGSVIVVLSATIGAGIVFFAVRSALGETIKQKAKGSIEKCA